MVFKLQRNVLSIPTLWRVLIRNGCYILSNAFSASIERIIWFLFFLLVIWSITLIALRVLNQPCILGINPTWSWWIVFLMYCWILLASILLRIFASLFIRDIGLYSPFWWGLCLVLELRWCSPHRTNLEVLHLFLSFQTAFLQTFRRIGMVSSLNVW